MMSKHPFRFFPARLVGLMLLVCLAWVAPVGAALAPHLDTIELDRVLADPRFNTLTGAGQSIAVLDTGLNADHIMINPLRVPAGANFVDTLAPLAPPSYADGDGHGTFVTSVAAGLPVSATLGTPLTLDNRTFHAGQSLEVEGVAPLASLVPVRVLDNAGNGTLIDIRDGLRWVIDNHQALNIRVVNMSLGTGNTFSDPSQITGGSAVARDIEAAVAELTDLGIAVVAASGNNGASDALSFPAILPEVISVGASEFDDSEPTREVVADFSNRSANLSLFAPGEDIVGALPAVLPGDPNTQLGVGSGTSFAAPQVAGAVLLLNEIFQVRHGRLPTMAEIRWLLNVSDTTIALADGTEVARLNLFTALERAYAIPEPTVALLLLIGLILLHGVRPQHRPTLRSLPASD